MTAATPTKLKLLRGRHGAAEALAHEPTPADVQELRPTTWLDRYALAVWAREAPILQKAGLISQADLGLLTQYCAAYGYWLLTYEKWINAGSPALYKNPNGQVHGHPLVKEWQQAQKDAMNLGAQLGLSPSARSKLGLAISEQMKNLKKYGAAGGSAKDDPEDRFFAA